MKARGLQTEYVVSPLDSVGDHPALNFINTLRMDGSELSDTWQSDEDVAVWIVREGLRDTLPSTTWPNGALLRRARALRENRPESSRSEKSKENALARRTEWFSRTVSQPLRCQRKVANRSSLRARVPPEDG
jgi:predicted RNA-binding Zn ribbon-like protein